MKINIKLNFNHFNIFFLFLSRKTVLLRHKFSTSQLKSCTFEWSMWLKVGIYKWALECFAVQLTNDWIIGPYSVDTANECFALNFDRCFLDRVYIQRKCERPITTIKKIDACIQHGWTSTKMLVISVCFVRYVKFRKLTRYYRYEYTSYHTATLLSWSFFFRRWKCWILLYLLFLLCMLLFFAMCMSFANVMIYTYCRQVHRKCFASVCCFP